MIDYEKKKMVGFTLKGENFDISGGGGQTYCFSEIYAFHLCQSNLFFTFSSTYNNEFLNYHQQIYVVLVYFYEIPE